MYFNLKKKERKREPKFQNKVMLFTTTPGNLYMGGYLSQRLYVVSKFRKEYWVPISERWDEWGLGYK